MSFVIKKMISRWRPLQLSLLFHGIIVLALINLNMSPVRPQNILVVDFSLGNEPLLRDGSRTTAASPPLKLQKNQRDRHPVATVKNLPSEELQPTVAPESSDTQDVSQKDIQTQVVAVSQTNLDTQMGLSEFARYGAQSMIYEAGIQKGSPSGLSSVGKGDIISSEKSRYIKAHFSYIKDLIHKHLIYPAQAKKMGWEGKVITSFIVSSGGYARDVRISKSSGYEILDENAIKAINNASPFPKPPVEAQIIIPILYRLN
jgi:periplasmic protein TonB